MDKNVIALVLDVKQSEPLKTEYVFTQGDTNSTRFSIRIRNGSNDIDYSTVDTGRIIFLKADNKAVAADMVKTDTGFTYDLQSNDISSVGILIVSVLLYGAGGERLTTTRFYCTVQSDSITPTQVSSTNEMRSLEQALVLLADTEETFDKLKADIESGMFNGAEVELQRSDTYIQWRYSGETEWKDLILIEDLRGLQGIQGI